MSLDYGILVFLTAKTLSRIRYQKAVQYVGSLFMFAGQAQLYRSLKKLEDGGLVKAGWVERAEVPNKKLYGVTDGGREALREWLLSTKRSDFLTHSSSMLQFFFSGTLNKEELIEFLDTQLEVNRGILKQLKDVLINNKKDFVGTLGCPKRFELPHGGIYLQVANVSYTSVYHVFRVNKRRYFDRRHRCLEYVKNY